MNGDLGKIYDRLEEVKVEIYNNALKQVAHGAKNDARHEENMRVNDSHRKDMDVLFESMRRYDKLPCKTHSERMKWLWIFISAGFGATSTALFIIFSNVK